MAGTEVALENTEAAVAAGVALETAAGVIDGPPVDPTSGCIAGAGADATSVSANDLLKSATRVPVYTVHTQLCQFKGMQQTSLNITPNPKQAYDRNAPYM